VLGGCLDQEEVDTLQMSFFLIQGRRHKPAERAVALTYRVGAAAAAGALAMPTEPIRGSVNQYLSRTGTAKSYSASLLRDAWRMFKASGNRQRQIAQDKR
jgi:hypothetical protein